ncbi:MAG TPA: helix-turn-helix domain-containing protein [Vicinamibacterales bacterium]|nr:helix-turn-helix domain-containing protein [Vicinamibacterales bacterium]
MRQVRARLGARLREWRRLRRLTQEALAERAGLSYKFIGEIERGRGNPTIDTLARLADALGIDVTDLLDSERSVDTRYPPLSARDLQAVREALESVETVLEQLGAGRYPRRRR